MDYQNIVKAQFVQRPNRFVAHVLVDGTTQVAHVRNTGRCRELLIPGAVVYLEHAPHPGRKTAYSLVAVEKGGLLINMDSQAPNRVVQEALEAGWLPPGLPGPAKQVRREVAYGDSRLDFRVELGDGPLLIEVKGVTLERDGAVYFPDAPTQRGIRHLEELTRAADSGISACALFVVQLEAASCLRPNDETHPAFGQALRAARHSGVRVCAYSCKVRPGSIVLDHAVPVEL